MFFLLKRAFNGRGRDFKVLVSPSVHPLVGGDAQSCNLRSIKKTNPIWVNQVDEDRVKEGNKGGGAAR